MAAGSAARTRTVMSKKSKASKSAQPAPPTADAPAPGVWLRELVADARPVLLPYLLSAVLLGWLFPPYGLWILGFVALVPWAVATCRAARAWLVHWLSFFVGWGFFLVTLRWLQPVTGAGYVALGLYLGIYWTLAAWAIRTARRHGIGLTWSLPVTWVACEFLRGTVMTGFPWLFVAHGFYEQLSLIQISDLVGAYGVSFVALMVNGTLAEFVLRRWPGAGPRIRARQLVAGLTVTILALVGTVVYGEYRLNQYDFENSPELHGPRIAVIQEDFPLHSRPPYSRKHHYEVLASYLKLAAEAAQEKPDLIVFPETVWSAAQNLDFIEIERAAIDMAHAGAWADGKRCHQAVSAFARGDYPSANAVISILEADLKRGAQYLDVEIPQALPRLPAEGGPPVTVVVGSVSYELFPETTYPKSKRYNSALVYDPDGTQRRERYDKVHLVPFGEVVPFRQARVWGIDLHWLYRWLNSLSPFSAGGRIEYSLTPGDTFTVFPLETADREYRFGVPICYEDATPYVCREFVWDGAKRRVDFLLSISNDAWFLYSNELPQHLGICVFRAVENRVGIARAVNTGISGFIDPNGRIYSRVTDEEGYSFRPGRGGIIGYDLHPVYLDPRGSLYGRFGDWFACLCVSATGLLWIGGVFERWVLAIKHRIERLLGKGV